MSVTVDQVSFCDQSSGVPVITSECLWIRPDPVEGGQSRSAGHQAFVSSGRRPNERKSQPKIDKRELTLPQIRNELHRSR